MARSRWEANYARALEYSVLHGAIRSWEHEPDTFWFLKIKRGVRSYLPDFKITRNDGTIQYHEVKGQMDQKSLTKLKRMALYYPQVEVLVIGPEEYGRIERTLGRGIEGWEE